MNGYVVNISSTWAHAMKRAVGPGAKISLDELFEQYGVKHNLQEGKEFVEWLRNVKLKDQHRWKIVTEEETVKAGPEKMDDRPAIVSPIVTTKTSVADIVGLSVREAREKLPKINDLNLLKYALQEANQLAGKDSLCIVLRKRIKDLQLTR